MNLSTVSSPRYIIGLDHHLKEMITEVARYQEAFVNLRANQMQKRPQQQQQLPHMMGMVPPMSNKPDMQQQLDHALVPGRPPSAVGLQGHQFPQPPQGQPQ